MKLLTKTPNTTEDKKKINAVDSVIDNLDCDLTILQKDILKRINYFVITSGEYIHIQSVTEKYYAEVASSTDIINSMKKLASDGWITESRRKTIFNGKFVTKIFYKINFFKIYEVA